MYIWKKGHVELARNQTVSEKKNRIRQKIGAADYIKPSKVSNNINIVELDWDIS
jgi:hypothetical protein